MLLRRLFGDNLLLGPVWLLPRSPGQKSTCITFIIKTVFYLITSSSIFSDTSNSNPANISSESLLVIVSAQGDLSLHFILWMGHTPINSHVKCVS